jgi:Tfp pilus assembly protein PilF
MIRIAGIVWLKAAAGTIAIAAWLTLAPMGWTATIDRPEVQIETESQKFTDLAQEKYVRGDVSGAIQDLDRAIDLDPNYAEAYVERGNIYYERGQLQRAKMDFDRATLLDRNRVRADLNRGNIDTAP